MEMVMWPNHFPLVKIWFILQFINQAFSSMDGHQASAASGHKWLKVGDEEFCKDGWWFFCPMLGGVNSNMCYVLTLKFGEDDPIQFCPPQIFQIGLWKTTRFHQPCRLEGEQQTRKTLRSNGWCFWANFIATKLPVGVTPNGGGSVRELSIAVSGSLNRW